MDDIIFFVIENKLKDDKFSQKNSILFLGNLMLSYEDVQMLQTFIISLQPPPTPQKKKKQWQQFCKVASDFSACQTTSPCMILGMY